MKVLFITTFLTISLVAIVQTNLVSAGDETPEPAASHEHFQNGDADYQFWIGERIRSSLLEECSLLIGVIGRIEDRSLELTVQERLWGENKNNVVTLDLNLIENSQFSRRSLGKNISSKLGSRLFVSICGVGANNNRFKVVIPNEEYFPAIKDVVLYEQRARQNPNLISEFPRMLASKDDSIFAGYATLFLRGSLDNREEVAKVLSSILEAKSVPPSGLALLRIKLRQLLIKEGADALDNLTRDEVIRQLIGAASRNDKIPDQVFILFLELVKRNKLDISSFLNKTNRDTFIANYFEFIRNNPSHTGRAEFERQLDSKH